MLPPRNWSGLHFSIVLLTEFVQQNGWPAIDLTGIRNAAVTADELKELTVLIEYRAGVMSEALAQRNDIPSYFCGILHFSRSTHPCTYFLVQGALRVAQFQAVYYKNKFQRPRPSQLSPNLLPPIEVPGHAAFPSGHATEAYSIAFVLNAVLDKVAETSDVVPSRAEPLLRLADRIARNREILGLHYRSDSEAGKYLAQETIRIFKGCPTVIRLIDAAAREWIAYSA